MLQKLVLLFPKNLKTYQRKVKHKIITTKIEAITTLTKIACLIKIVILVLSALIVQQINEIGIFISNAVACLLFSANVFLL